MANRTPVLDREAITDATTDVTDLAAKRMDDVLDQADEVRRTALAEAGSILARIRASTSDLGQILRSARDSVEQAGDTSAESVRTTRDAALASAELARSKAEEAAAIGRRAVRTAEALAESARDAVEDAGTAVDRARQVVGDAIAGPAAERVRGRRTSRRMRVGLLATGVAGGAAATYFLDAKRGPDRRRLAIDRLRTSGATVRAALARAASDLSNRWRARSATVRDFSDSRWTAQPSPDPWPDADAGAAMPPVDAPDASQIPANDPR